MKRKLTIIFTAVLAISAISAFVAKAVDDSYIGPDGFDHSCTPPDAWDGDYAEYENKDGSVTAVFDNGSVVTVYSDGTKVGVDYYGNEHFADKDGNHEVHCIDGSVAKEHSNGDTSVSKPDGCTLLIHQDGTFSEKYDNVGVTIDYDSNGHCEGIGLNGDSQRIGTDEYGFYNNGEIRTKDGQLLQITDEGMKIINAEGTVSEYKNSGNVESSTVDWQNGAHAEATTTTTWENGQKTTDTDLIINDPESGKWEANMNITYDREGKPYYSNNNVYQWTSNEGEKLWVDGNSNAFDYNGKNGEKLIVDPDSRIRDLHDDKNDWHIEYGDNGKPVSGYLKFSDGTNAEIGTDGLITVTYPDGTTYVSDDLGNVIRDGLQIEENGEWLTDNQEEEEEDEEEPEEEEDEEDDDEMDPGDKPSGVGSLTQHQYDSMKQEIDRLIKESDKAYIEYQEAMAKVRALDVE